ncbi:replicative DNA helicase [Caldifermentibacillus hisashii]|uniref:replicative DNA helicase n=1 Tax=Caldifermentibacillus hisashii TaxID=996558 RepID=UPI0022B99057|nr:DnaB-like helicase C-terminal domain-containing protein [Caldifermentibacillus hisashii]
MMHEKVFLGCLMQENPLINDTVIRPDHLQDLRHKQLYSKMVELHSAGKYFNLISLSMLPDLEIYGGISYLNELNAFCDLEKFDEVEELILDAWKEQQTQMILTKATFEKWESARVIDELEKIENLKLKNGTTISEGLAAIYEAPWEEKEDTTGITTGIQALDDITGGFQEGEVTILAARPSMGKTDVMLHFAKETGWAGYLPILFSLEMPEKLIISRLVASTGNINRVKMRNPYKFLKPKQKEKWTTIIANLDETNMIIFDESGQTIPEMRAQIRKLMYEYPDRKPVVFIDYLTLIRPINPYFGNTHQQVSEISQGLKKMAKDFHIPVICLAQLNRSVETRSNKRPLMSDIRESGSIEQDADVIIFLYREKYYDREITDNSLELIIAKNRNGPVGTVIVKYNEHTGKIESR